MSKAKSPPTAAPGATRARPVRRFIVRGLGVVMPPLLTLVLFLWAWATVERYVLQPIEGIATSVAVFFSMRFEVRDGIPDNAPPAAVSVRDAQGRRVPTEELARQMASGTSVAAVVRLKGWHVDGFADDGVAYLPAADQKWIPQSVLDAVRKDPGDLKLATATARNVYERYVLTHYLQRWRTIPVFLVVFIIVLYFLGRSLASRVGRMFVTGVDTLISQVPLVRNVYSAVKQVTDLVFSEREFQFNRVVAVQYPRIGVWSLGFLVSDSLLDIRAAANEPVVAVLMPTSPMPATGFIITVRKSEVLDVDITLDEAIQFLVSCGVVTPARGITNAESAGSSEVVSRLPAQAVAECDITPRRRVPE